MGNTPKLNPQQQEAVDFTDGQLLVVAGAGTGKTKVIVERIVKLISSGVDPKQILALTFTEKAASEMLDRVNELRGSYSLDTTIMTFNAFGSELLQSFAPDVGLPSDMRLLGDTGKLVFIREHLDKFELDYYAPINSPDSQISTIADHISELKQQLVTPQNYLDYVKSLPAKTEDEQLEKQRLTELAKAFEIYQNLSKEYGVIDYDDQIYLVVDLLQKRPNVVKILNDEFGHIMVDEFQDTNPMQSKLLDLLTKNTGNLMVVGDDDQSIYGWRGATLANILDFTKRYPEASEVTLIENYRSDQAILDSAYRLIQHNNPERLEVMNQLDKKLKSQSGQGKKPKVHHFSSLDAELAWVSEDISKRIKADQSPGTIAVLARRNAGVQAIHSALEMNEIDHVVASQTTDIYNQQSVTGVIEALKAIDDPADDAALFHTLGGPIFRIDPQILAQLSSTAKADLSSLNTVIQDSTDEVLVAALEQIEQWRSRSHDQNVGQLAYDIISESGWKDRLYDLGEQSDAGAIQVQALGQFFKTMKEFEQVSNQPSTKEFLISLPTLMSSHTGIIDDTLLLSENQVNVLSVHKAKGLEWDTVYVVDCTEGSFPMRSFGSSVNVPDELKIHSSADDHMAEERRLMYVAMTRASKELLLSYSDHHSTPTLRRPSRFLAEIDETEKDQRKADDDQITMELFSQVSSPKMAKAPKQMISGSNIQLTASQIGDFLRCEIDFYYRHILNVPPPPNASGAYGTVIHSVIQQMNVAKSRDEEIDVDEILKSVENKWPTHGYSSKVQRDRAKKQGIATIKLLAEKLSKEPTPRFIEKPFKVHIPDSKLIIKGRIDAVFEDKEGTEIRDYKTGKTVVDEKKAKSRAQSSVQLSIYALAWQLQYDELPKILSLDFVETNQLGSVKKRQDTIDRLQETLKSIPEVILSSSYSTGRDHTFCRHPID